MLKLFRLIRPYRGSVLVILVLALAQSLANRSSRGRRTTRRRCSRSSFMLLSMVITAPMMAIGGVLMALSHDATLAWVLVAMIPVVGLVFFVIMGRAVPLFQVMQVKLDTLNLVLDEALTGVRVIRAFNREAHEHRRFDAANTDVTDTALRVNRIVAFLMPAMMLMMNVTSIAILWFGADRIDAGTMALGAVMASLQYAMQIMFAVFMVTAMFIMLPRAAASAQQRKWT